LRSLTSKLNLRSLIPSCCHCAIIIMKLLIRVSLQPLWKGGHATPTLSTSLWREMTITLNDVSSLLHLSIVGQFCSYVTLYFTLTSSILVKLLGVEFGTKLRHHHNAHVRLSWSFEVYKECIIHYIWEYTTQAYLLHFVADTIFAYKSLTSVNVSYLPLFSNPRMHGGYARRAAAFTHMFNQLGHVSFAQTK